jgi:TetR/AcrR family transcriptional regulator
LIRASSRDGSLFAPPTLWNNATSMRKRRTMHGSTIPEGRRQLQSQERRRRVLAAANRCFGLHGFRQTSVEMIAEEAGVSKALVFAFFRHKDALYDAVIEQTLLAWTGFAEHQAARYRDQPAQELASLFRGSFEFASHSPMLRVLMAHRDRQLQERLSSLPRIVRDWRMRFAEVIQRGIDQGGFRADLDPQRVSVVIHEIQHLYLDLQVAGEHGAYDPERMELALGLLMRGIQSGDPAPAADRMPSSASKRRTRKG